MTRVAALRLRRGGHDGDRRAGAPRGDGRRAGRQPPARRRRPAHAARRLSASWPATVGSIPRPRCRTQGLEPLDRVDLRWEEGGRAVTFRPVLREDDLWIGEMAGVKVDGHPVLLVNVEGTVCAYEDRCRHRAQPLSQGRLTGNRLVCAAHAWEYDAATGRGINPDGVALPPLRRPDRGRRDRGGHRCSLSGWRPSEVGPVLLAGRVSDAIVAAIRTHNAGVRVSQHGSYLRVAVASRCEVRAQAVAELLGEPFRIPQDLERVMPSFRGRLRLSEELAAWEASAPAMKPIAQDLLAPRGRPTAPLRLRDRHLAAPLLRRARRLRGQAAASEFYARHQAGSLLGLRSLGGVRRSARDDLHDVRRPRGANARPTSAGCSPRSRSPSYDRQLAARMASRRWARALSPLRFLCHGLQMVAAYVGQMAPSGRIAVAALFQCGDEIRRIQRFAYRLAQLARRRPDSAATGARSGSPIPLAAVAARDRDAARHLRLGRGVRRAQRLPEADDRRALPGRAGRRSRTARATTWTRRSSARCSRTASGTAPGPRRCSTLAIADRPENRAVVGALDRAPGRPIVDAAAARRPAGERARLRAPSRRPGRRRAVPRDRERGARLANGGTLPATGGRPPSSSSPTRASTASGPATASSAVSTGTRRWSASPGCRPRGCSGYGIVEVLSRIGRRRRRGRASARVLDGHDGDLRPAAARRPRRRSRPHVPHATTCRSAPRRARWSASRRSSATSPRSSASARTCARPTPASGTWPTPRRCCSGCRAPTGSARSSTRPGWSSPAGRWKRNGAWAGPRTSTSRTSRRASRPTAPPSTSGACSRWSTACGARTASTAGSSTAARPATRPTAASPATSAPASTSRSGATWRPICARAIEARDDFLSVASHELGTPLTALQLHVDQLQRTLGRRPAARRSRPRPAARSRRGSARSPRRSDASAQLVETLLDSTRLAVGAWKPHLRAGRPGRARRAAGAGPRRRWPRRPAARSSLRSQPGLLGNLGPRPPRAGADQRPGQRLQVRRRRAGRDLPSRATAPRPRCAFATTASGCRRSSRR